LSVQSKLEYEAWFLFYPSMLRICIFLIASTLSLISETPVIAVWPEDRVPGKVTEEPETLIPRADGYQRMTHVSSPTLTFFAASDVKGLPKPAVIVCPGGAYRYTVMDKEGSAIARRFNQAGISALVLKYRTPDNREGALQDLQRALSLTRSRAFEWDIDPDRIGVIGFSAGGHLAASASTQFTARRYEAIDSVDTLSCRPDFVMLVYPAYLDDKQGNVSTDLNLQVDIPPSLILHSEDDRNHVTGSRLYAKRLKEKGGQHAFKLYSSGGHGYGLHSKGEARVWPDEAIEWLRAIGTQ
jgi:acetyl esterase/lipase